MRWFVGGLVLMQFICADTLACFCFGPPTVQSGLERSDDAFAATIVELRLPAPTDSLLSEDYSVYKSYEKGAYVLYKVSIERVFKGDQKPGIALIYTSSSSASCGSVLTIGKQYLIYGRRRLPGSPRLVWTDMCTRTKIFNIHEAIALDFISCYPEPHLVQASTFYFF